MTRTRIALLYVGLVALLLAGTWLVARETDALTSFVRTRLAEVFRPECFSLGGAGVDLGTGRIELRELHLFPQDPAEQGRFDLRIRRLEIGFATHPLRDPTNFRSFAAHDAVLDLVLVDGALPDLADVFRPNWSFGSSSTSGSAPRPAVSLRDVLLRLHSAPGRDPLELRLASLDMSTATAPATAGNPEEPGAAGYAISVDGLELVGGPGVAMHGTFDPASQRLSLRGTSPEGETSPLDLRLVRRADPELADTLAGYGPLGELCALAFDVETGTDGAVSAHANATLREVSLTGPLVPYPLLGMALELEVSSGPDGHRIHFAADQPDHGDGRIAADGDIGLRVGERPRFDIGFHGRAVRVDDRLGSALHDVDEARAVWEAFQPASGRADVDGRIRTAPGDADEAPEFTMELTLDGVGARYVGFVDSQSGLRTYGFPHPLSDVRGRIAVGGGRVTVADVTARLDDAMVGIGGEVDVRGDGPPTIGLHIGGENLTFSQRIRSALADLHAPSAHVWDEYAPSGRTDLDVQIDVGPAAANPGVQVRLRPRGASATYAGFPYRVDGLTGEIAIDPTEVRIGLEGQRDDGQVEIHGRFVTVDETPPDQFHSDLFVRASGIGTSTDLLTALQSYVGPARAQIDALALRAGADVEVAMWRQTLAAPFSYDVRVDLHEGSARVRPDTSPDGPPAPELRLTDIEGSVFIHGDGEDATIDVTHVAARIPQEDGDAEVSISGRADVRDAGGRLRSDLSAVVESLRLTDRIAAVAVGFGAFDMGTWQMLQPSGTVDLIWRRWEGSGGDVRQELTAELRDVGIEAAFLPGDASGIRGQVRITDGTVDVRNMTGHMLDAQFACPEVRVWQGDGGLHVVARHVRSDDFPVEPLGRMLSGPMRRTFEERDPRGRCRIEELELTFVLPDDGGDFTTTVTGRAQALGLSLLVGSRLERLSGTCTIEAARFDGAGGAMSGHVRDASVVVFGHRLTDVSASFTSTQDYVLFNDLAARLHRGRVVGTDSVSSIYYAFADAGELRADLRWENLSLQELLGSTAAEARDGMSGNLSGELHLARILGTDLSTAIGNGSVTIRGGRLANDPIFRSIYAYLERPRRPIFSDLDARFTFRDDALQIEELTVKSQQAEMRGKGRVGFDGYIDIDLDLPDFFGRESDWLFLPWVARTTLNQFAAAHAYGYLRAPVVEIRYLGDGDPRRVPLRPLPPAGPGGAP
ncbi:MAG: hypothetical protein IPM29_03490 [Planctomycetes bacterium]|nr:hypothetical protein [Planctomycetota bacterium]